MISHLARNFHKNRGEDRGDLLIRGLRAHCTDCIINVCVTDTDANSNRSKDPAKVLAAHERGEVSRGYALNNVIISLRSWSPQIVFLARKQKSC
jgi:hypothetical protein